MRHYRKQIELRFQREVGSAWAIVMYGQAVVRAGCCSWGFEEVIGVQRLTWRRRMPGAWSDESSRKRYRSTVVPYPEVCFGRISPGRCVIRRACTTSGSRAPPRLGGFQFLMQLER